jgi:hypothetical protein
MPKASPHPKKRMKTNLEDSTAISCPFGIDTKGECFGGYRRAKLIDGPLNDEEFPFFCNLKYYFYKREYW